MRKQSDRKMILVPGQRVVLTSGDIAVVAFVRYGQVFVFGRNGLPVAGIPVGDAWGGEHDQEIGLVA